MKNTLIVLLAGLGLILMGNTKAEITSECTLRGDGEYQCNFENKGKKKESTCVHMTLGGKFGQTVFHSASDRIGVTNNRRHETIIADLKGDTKYYEGIAKEPQGVSDYQHRANKAATAQRMKKLDDEIAALEMQNNRAVTPLPILLVEQKKIAASKRKKLDSYVKENLMELSYLVVGGHSKGLSGEICSGIVEPGDLRERHGTVHFSGVPLGYAELDAEHTNLSPKDACLTEGESWSGVCSFETLTVSELRKYVKDAIQSASEIEKDHKNSAVDVETPPEAPPETPAESGRKYFQ